MRYSWENPLIPSDCWSQAIVDAVSTALRITKADSHVLNENLLNSKWVLPPFPAIVEDGGYYADAEDDASDLIDTTVHPDYMISDLLNDEEDSDIISV